MGLFLDIYFHVQNFVKRKKPVNIKKIATTIFSIFIKKIQGNVFMNLNLSNIK